MKRSVLALVILMSFVLAGCGTVNSLLGVVPQANLDTAVGRITELEGQLAEKVTALADLQTELTTTYSDIERLEAVNVGVEVRNDMLEERNENLESLICPDHTWEEFWSEIAIWLPQDWFEREDFVEAFERLIVDWDFQPELTQWTEYGLAGVPWRDDLPGYLLIWDGQSAAWSVDEHCLILDPAVYDLGR